MKKTLSFIMVLAMLVCFASCQANVEVPTEGTASEKYAAVFTAGAEQGKDMNAIASDLINAKILKYALQKTSIKEGYITGYKTQITGFEEAIQITTKVGSTPFLMDIFKTSNPDALKALVEENYMLNFQICEVADEVQITAVGNYVFVVMCPSAS